MRTLILIASLVATLAVSAYAQQCQTSCERWWDGSQHCTTRCTR